MRFKIFLYFLFLAGSLFAQDVKPPFYNEINAFKKQDSIIFPGKNSILFIGSSSFTMWNDLQQDFPDYIIINRGFGGSTLLDQINYVKDIVYPYQPKQIIIYCGENDLASSDTVTPKIVLSRFTHLFHLIRNRLPGASIIYISIKPSPSRHVLMDKMKETNALIRDFLKTKKRTGFIDVYKEMIDDKGKPVAELFLQDNLHMNSKGYAIWKKLIKPHLLK